MWEPSTLDRRAEIASELAVIGNEIADGELEYFGRFLEAFCATERGELDRARAGCIALRDLAPSINNEYFEFLSERLLLSIDIAQGEQDVQQRIDALAARHADTYADTDGTWALQTGGLAYEAGTMGGMVPALVEMTAGPHGRTWRTALALAHVCAGDDDAAAKVAAQVEDVPKSYFWITATQTHAEVAASLVLAERCEQLFEELLPFRDQVGVTASGSRLFGLVSRSLGDLALALGRHDEAIDFLEQAVADADSFGMAFEGTVSRRLLAQAHHGVGDAERAAAIAAEALPVAVERGNTREVAFLEVLLD